MAAMEALPGSLPVPGSKSWSRARRCRRRPPISCAKWSVWTVS